MVDRCDTYSSRPSRCRFPALAIYCRDHLRSEAQNDQGVQIVATEQLGELCLQAVPLRLLVAI
jgi:hypothetical protein